MQNAAAKEAPAAAPGFGYGGGQHVPMQQIQPQQPQSWPALPEQTAAYQNTGSFLPFGGSPQEGNSQATQALCLGAFMDLINNHNEILTGESTADKVYAFIDEVNTVLGEDRMSKHSFAMQL